MSPEELEAKYHELRSCRAVAEYYGVSDETIRRRCKQYGISRRGWKRPEHIAGAKDKNKKLTADDVQQIIDIYKRTNSEKETAHITEHSLTTVSKYLQKAGIAPGIGGNQTKQMKITDEQILEAVKTMTRHEIADMYGVHVENLARRMRKLGVHAVYAVSHQELADTWHYTDTCAEFIRAHQPGFELVEFKRDRCRLRCKKCGNIVERSRSTIREKNVRCERCYQMQKENEAKAKAFVRLLNKIIEKAKPKVCSCCGSTFYSESPTAKWCPRCRNLNKGDYRNRAKKYGVFYEHGITLRKVMIRDKGICQICGKPVDLSDKSWNGCFGPFYPTLDHIVALANGGSHTWNNVQLAHAICNSYKRDLI